MNLLERWLARRDPRRQQPHESRAIWQTRRLAERSGEQHPELGPAVHPRTGPERAPGGEIRFRTVDPAGTRSEWGPWLKAGAVELERPHSGWAWETEHRPPAAEAPGPLSAVRITR